MTVRSKQATLLMLLLASSVLAQTPTQTTLRGCFTRAAASRWCVPADGTSVNAQGVQPAQAYCCADASTDPKCTHGDDYKCTLNNKGQMDVSLWSTYWPGITEEICGGAGSSRQVMATSELQTITPDSLVISNRAADQGYTEACHWLITVDEKAWRKESEIFIYMNASTTSQMKVFGGKDLRNATEIITNNQSMVLGAPIRVPISSGAIIVEQVSAPARTGSTTFSFEVVGIPYPWYEKPFIGVPVGWYYVFGVAFFPVAICVLFGDVITVSILLLLLFVLGLVFGPGIAAILAPLLLLGCCLVTIGGAGGLGFFFYKKKQGGVAKAPKPAAASSTGAARRGVRKTATAAQLSKQSTLNQKRGSVTDSSSKLNGSAKLKAADTSSTGLQKKRTSVSNAPTAAAQPRRNRK